jgi:NAD(P)-dependent dehydrogenase (short-subunit alcohol dehydrogenase family)
MTVDVREQEAVDTAVGEVTKQLGTVSLLVNNAGTPGPAGKEWEADPSAWWECIESIVRGAYLCSRSVLPFMINAGGGRIVHVASVTGTSPWPLVSATSVAKSALIRHAENLAAAAGPDGIKVFALHPGIVRTVLLESYRSDPTMASILDSIPDSAYSPPEVAAEAVSRLATGGLDDLSGCFVDATSDLDAALDVVKTGGSDVLRLRLHPGP